MVFMCRSSSYPKYKLICSFLVSNLKTFLDFFKFSFKILLTRYTSGKIWTVSFLCSYYLWIIQFPGHTNFWEMPFFYPIPDTLIMGDMLIGGAPIYCFLRIFFEPLSAFQVFAILVCIINYSSFYYLLNKQLKFSPLASSVGSFLFAFSLYRYYKFPHLNYFIQFYSVWILICLFKINKKNTILKNSILACLIAIFFSIQFLSI